MCNNNSNSRRHQEGKRSIKNTKKTGRRIPYKHDDQPTNQHLCMADRREGGREGKGSLYKEKIVEEIIVRVDGKTSSSLYPSHVSSPSCIS
ncbi:hypothetical protein Pmani_034381 [Petrolisthes manimaculis]|uniref:Uncharacterized protein n=1 Tax=Petrolisthes manimaculis TaxID=1843537 RepID=A0AAE1TRL3_9EUCA|nr:hypothetical protein Pmani_034381 [Petrolisthes manimaculis]